MGAKIEVKGAHQARTISGLSTEFEVVPGVVYGVLSELGIQHDGDQFTADDDAYELIQTTLLDVEDPKLITVKKGLTPRDFAVAVNVPPADVQKTLVAKLRAMVTQNSSLKDDQAERLANEYGFKLKWSEIAHKKPVAKAVVSAKKSEAGPRPPVVTIMGHVDHGKTSLLDMIRKANVASKEHGGITQHIGAYQVELPEGKITFLDTPGHAAFTAMRARGAQVTDIAVLVVAADDGIMPQTIEAIQHAKNAKVPIIIAVNKIDRPDANPDRVLQQLPEHEVIPEAYGGDVITCNVSAVTGEGIPHLLEMILLQAEVLELKALATGPAKGSVIEAKIDRGRGPVATILVQEGLLKTGDSLVVGTAYGRIKAMTNYLGERINEAGPSTPVEVLGLSEAPDAGDPIEVVADERTARNIATDRAETERIASVTTKKRGLTLGELKRRLDEDEGKELNLIIKADVQGSVEAVRGMLEKIKNEEVEAKVILSGVGSITQSDILLASASNAIVVGFNIKPEADAKKEAERRKVEIRTYTIIYELIEDIEAAAKGMLEPKFEEQHLGELDIRVRFQLSKKGIIAGCYVTEGKVIRNAKCRVRRGNELVYEGSVGSLRHLKDDVREVTLGMECGVTFDNWTDFQEGDVVEAFELVQVNA